MPKRYKKQTTFAERAIITNNVKKVINRRAYIENEKRILPITLSLLIHSDKHIDAYTALPHMTSYNFKSKTDFYQSCSLAALLIVGFNIKFLKYPNLLHEAPEKFVVSNNLNFPQHLGKVSGLTRNQKILPHNYEDFKTKIINLLEDNKNCLGDTSENGLYKYLPNSKLQLHAKKLYMHITSTLQHIKQDPYYLYPVYEILYFLKSTYDPNISKKENLCQ